MTLSLKPVPDEDLYAFYEMVADPTLSINTGSIPYPIDLDWARQRLMKQRRGEQEGTRMDRGLYEGETLVGMAGWFRNEKGQIELGYAIHKDHRGRGFATKAAVMVLNMLRESGCKEPVYAQYFKDNVASGRVLEKLGFTVEQATEGMSIARGGSAPAWLMRLDML